MAHIIVYKTKTSAAIMKIFCKDEGEGKEGVEEMLKRTDRAGM